METYSKIIETAYEGADLITELSLLNQSSTNRACYEGRFSRSGKTLVYHGFHMGNVSHTEDDVIREMKDFLFSEYSVYADCDSYEDFIWMFGSEMSESLYESMKESGRIISEFFSAEELMSFRIE